jgi:hypothetical protein
VCNATTSFQHEPVLPDASQDYLPAGLETLHISGWDADSPDHERVVALAPSLQVKNLHFSIIMCDDVRDKFEMRKRKHVFFQEAVKIMEAVGRS